MDISSQWHRVNKEDFSKGRSNGDPDQPSHPSIAVLIKAGAILDNKEPGKILKQEVRHSLREAIKIFAEIHEFRINLHKNSYWLW